MTSTTRVDQSEQGGRTIYTLVDEATGASAAITPSYGFNLFDLRLPAAGAVRRVIVAKDDFAANPEKPGRNGIPILFPFPNRIRDGRYTFEGKDRGLSIEPGKEHAIHGFAISAPWDVLDRGATPEGAFLVGRFQISTNAPERLASWPSDAVLTVRYDLAGRRLAMTITVENPTTSRDLPFGFGIHPYFRLPFAAGTPDRGSLHLPASQMWTLAGSLPTGERVPVDPRVDFRHGGSTTGRHLDDVLTGLAFDGEWCTCRLVDEDLGCATLLSFDRAFRELVVFVPPHDDTLVAVEPYTQTTDAINLEARGVDAGLRVLKPGGSTTMRIAIETVDTAGGDRAD